MNRKNLDKRGLGDKMTQFSREFPIDRSSPDSSWIPIDSMNNPSQRFVDKQAR